MPLKTVEKKGFLRLMKQLVPHYKVPCRNTITRFLDEKYDSVFPDVRDQLERVGSIALTADLWTEGHNCNSIMGVTAHFITDEFELKSIILGEEIFPFFPFFFLKK